jgi:hypothetical protein
LHVPIYELLPLQKLSNNLFPLRLQLIFNIHHLKGRLYC